ncbi:MAG: hypothetical protein A2887_04120 [Alphaproteobacteria bacterium RIFCSPLOWO2_01_FULL_40_26]|nr:MAG: hypothetical protein A3D15_01905 [Alphaproteobacteria bacterium RIFCSPHIGHO2_02_FULL_40_34]OFW93923.1 MAG: hypothetical protein A2887_04120 [Alphaproteobacteria bacterium RIFCSPLOWO2_01_FULL_40_26]OFX09417.1 MAG: hypothetical protein A3H30_01735 [Alphaproteobacteria bacterium RIFCSPLOWO2_02_FULL_40_19]OFX11966.1 MAG: hypothetical protein A3G22_05280 [Alphaproteobacteria bacterium RIFCSPLOWO2_12_FULL_40_11]
MSRREAAESKRERSGSELSEDGNKYPINQEAFTFLPRCVGSRFDMTSAEPPHPRLTSIIPPTSIVELMRTVDFDGLEEVHGMSRGEDFMLEACVGFFSRRGIRCDRDHVSLTMGILPTLEHVYQKLGLNESNKIIVPTPTFGYFFRQFKEKNISFETLPTKEEDGFLPNPEELERLIVSSGAKAILLCYPNNPTGSVMTEECAMAIADIATRHDIFVISDEAFVRNSLSGRPHFSVAAVDGMLERSFTVTSTAKSMFIGVKNGCCVGRSDIVADFERLGGYPTKHMQRILTAALEDNAENKKYLDSCRDHYIRNIGVVTDKLTELDRRFCEQFDEARSFVKPLIAMPDATNVYLLDFSGLRGKKYGEKVMMTGLDVAEWLLN